MTDHPAKNNLRILALYPYRRGFGFAVLERTRLVDWGVARLYSKSDNEFAVRVEALANSYRVNALAVEDGSNKRRSVVAMRRVRRATEFGKDRRVWICPLSHADVAVALGMSGRHTNHQIAAKLAEYFPELLPTLPAKRRFFDPEDEKMHVFRAVGLAAAVICSA